jgi:chromosome partitioning protein
VKVIALSSIKGGVGKTTTAVNLAHLAAGNGSRVLLWDLDPQGAATYTLCVGERVAGGGRRLVRRTKELARSPVPTRYPGLDVVPADFSLRYLDLELSTVPKPGRRLDDMLEHLRDDYDYVVLDCPPGISLTIDSALRATDVVLVPVIPAALPLRSFDQLASYVRAERKLGRLQVLAFLSMVDRRKRAHREMCDTLPTERDNVLAQWIPAAVDIENMAALRSPVVEHRPTSTSATAYRLLLDELIERT